MKNGLFYLPLLIIGSNADAWNLKIVRAEGDIGDNDLYVTIEDPATDEMVGRTTTIPNYRQWDETFTIDDSEVSSLALRLYGDDDQLIDEASINMAPNTAAIENVCDVELAERLPLDNTDGYLFVLLFQDCDHEDPGGEPSEDYDYVDEYSGKSMEEVGLAIDIAKLSNYMSVLGTGLGIVDLVSGNYGAQVRIKNFLCGGHLFYESGFYLAKGSFKAHCASVVGGTEAGCTVNGWWNNGVYGMVQYEFKNTTAIPDHCRALNVFFQASQGWGWGSQKKNRVDVFWSNELCERREDNKDDITCYLNQRRNRDNKKCWLREGVYDPLCSEKWDDPTARGVCGGIHALGNIGSGNNPQVNIEVRAPLAPIQDGCGDPEQ